MKKYLFGLAALSLLFALTGCQKETVEKPGDSAEIKFQTYPGKQTRAEETDLARLKTLSQSDGIPVDIYKNSDHNSWKYWELEWDGTDTWEYNGGTPVFAPDFALNYYSWYPKTTVTALTNTAGVVTFPYTVPAVAAQEDLIVASALNVTTPDVLLTYSHILSQVNFALQNVNGVQITINSITVADIADEATYTFGTGWGTPTFTTAPTYAYDLTAITMPATTGLHGIGAAPLGSGSSADGNALMLMPQTFDATSAGKFSVNFTLQDEDDNVVADAHDAVAYLRDFPTTTWVPNTRYIYLIDFTNYLADRYIKFDVAVTSWADATNPAMQVVEIAQATKTSLEGAIASLASYNGAGIQIHAASDLEEDIELDFTVSFTAGFKIVIYAGDLATYDITVSGNAWSVDKDASNAFVTLTKLP